MAESKDPRNRLSPEPDGDGGYDVLGDDASDSDAAAEGLGQPSEGVLDDSDALETDSEPRRVSKAPVAPLPRLWKAAPEPGTAPGEPSSAKGRREPAEPPSKETPSKDRPAAKSRTTERNNSVGKIERVGTVRSQSEKAGAASRPREVRRPRDRDDSGDDGQKKTLIEETPELDTYEARQKVRIALGVGLFAAVLLIGFVVVRAVLPGAPPPAPPPEPTVVLPPAGPQGANREALEQEARVLLDRARIVAKGGNVVVAIQLLEKITKSYAETKTAKEAQAALDRPGHNLPLFPDTPVVVATTQPTRPRTVRNAAPPAVVDATAPQAPMPAAGEVSLVVPPNFPGGPAGGTTGVPEPAGPSVGTPLPKGFHSAPGSKVHSSGWALEIVGERDGAMMVLVPGGEFLMGRDDGEQAERPAHRVQLSTFYVDRTEVTVRQFELHQKEVGRRPGRDSAIARESGPVSTSDDSPVVMVTAKEAKDYATWAGKKMPTEAQWEMAARGNDGRLYPWGPLPPSWGEAQPRVLDAVMSFAEDVSPYGAYDMAGNAWEWTKDWYERDFYALFRGKVSTDPLGPLIRPRSQHLAVRGCSSSWTITKREGMRYEFRLPYLGFRCVLQVEGPGNAFESPKARGTEREQGESGTPAGGMAPF